MPDHNNPPQPALLMIRGIPGSGKSYLAAALERALGRDRLVLLDPDAVDRSSEEYRAYCRILDAEGASPERYPYYFLRNRAYESVVADKIVVWNQPFTEPGMFGRLVAKIQAHAAEHGKTLPTLVVEVEVDPSVAKRRIADRKLQGGHGPSDRTLVRRIGDYKSVAGDYAVVAVDGQADASVSAAKVLQALEALSR